MPTRSAAAVAAAVYGQKARYSVERQIRGICVRAGAAAARMRRLNGRYQAVLPADGNSRHYCIARPCNDAFRPFAAPPTAARRGSRPKVSSPTLPFPCLPQKASDRTKTKGTRFINSGSPFFGSVLLSKVLLLRTAPHPTRPPRTLIK